jgi:hypothetical protein
VPKIAQPKFWLANILVDLFLAHKLANMAEIELVVGHWRAKKLQQSKQELNARSALSLADELPPDGNILDWGTQKMTVSPNFEFLSTCTWFTKSMHFPPFVFRTLN